MVRLYVLLASRTPLGSRLIPGQIFSQKIEPLSLPLLILLMFDEDPLGIVDVGFQFASRDQLVNPGFGTAELPSRSLRV